MWTLRRRHGYRTQKHRGCAKGVGHHQSILQGEGDKDKWKKDSLDENWGEIQKRRKWTANSTKNHSERLLINNEEIEKVSIFKYLWAWITSDDKIGHHMAARTKAAWGGIGYLKKLGFYNENLAPKVKGLLFQAYYRSRSTYALECINLSQNAISDLIKMENKTIRKSFNLTSRSRIEEIYFAMGIKKLDKAIEKRELTFIRQLLTNAATGEVLVKSTINSRHNSTLRRIGFEYNDGKMHSSPK
jgi:hypothetical protein